MTTPAMHHLPASGPPRASVLLLHGHGAEAAVHLQDAAALVDERRRDAILEVARAWRAELPALAASCRARGVARVGVLGISMGGFAALAALAAPCPFDAVAALLAAPVLVDRAAVIPGRPPLLLGLAGRDAAVPPGPSRRFAQDYGAELLEYPDSEHLMRGADWRDLWRRTAAFLHGHLLA